MTTLASRTGVVRRVQYTFCKSADLYEPRLQTPSKGPVQSSLSEWSKRPFWVHTQLCFRGREVSVATVLLLQRVQDSACVRLQAEVSQSGRGRRQVREVACGRRVAVGVEKRQRRERVVVGDRTKNVGLQMYDQTDAEIGS